MANARQIMYAARPHVLALTGGKCWSKSSYFTQTLLPNFLEAHRELTADWDVVFDDRGHFLEPHTHARIGLGTLAVRGYIQAWHREVPTEVGSVTLRHECPTKGPANRYRYAVFVESTRGRGVPAKGPPSADVDALYEFIFHLSPCGQRGAFIDGAQTGSR
jgi:hypothetical protein